ncbi:hypothetical protein Pmani_023406 [Petrolisthes manimaculis]|uniref:Uncharacterized protein n=1 Tax=Petrolisthes manimaculis TaxID=1843537 RepID=A0AAE1PAR9_9EUCA|nr:hypothetical protein Pmani_023406 [Petrolisthes manimaculis]
MSVSAASLPHVYHAVSELSAVSSTQRWANTKVRVVGKLRRPDVARRTAILESIGEPDGTFQVDMNIEAVGDLNIPENSVVTVLGELEVEFAQPCITAKIVRECNNLDLQNHAQIVEAVRRRFPRLLQ